MSHPVKRCLLLGTEHSNITLPWWGRQGWPFHHLHLPGVLGGSSSDARAAPGRLVGARQAGRGSAVSMAALTCTELTIYLLP